MTVPKARPAICAGRARPYPDAKGKPLPGFEVHSADGRSYIFRDGSGWKVVFDGKIVENVFKTRQLARDYIRAAKVLLS